MYILGIHILGSDLVIKLTVDNTDNLVICSLITTKCEDNRKCFFLVVVVSFEMHV